MQRAQAAGFAAALATAFLVSAASAQACEAVEVSEARQILSGLAPAEDVICFALTGSPGQSLELAVEAGDNSIFSVPGLDAQDRAVLTLEQTPTRVLVGQLMRAVEPQEFVISITPLGGSGVGR